MASQTNAVFETIVVHSLLPVCAPPDGWPCPSLPRPPQRWEAMTCAEGVARFGQRLLLALTVPLAILVWLPVILTFLARAADAGPRSTSTPKNNENKLMMITAT